MPARIPDTEHTEVYSTRLNAAEAGAVRRYAAEHGCSESAAMAALIRQGFLVSLGPQEPGVPTIVPNAMGCVDLSISFTHGQWPLFQRLMRLLTEYPDAN